MMTNPKTFNLVTRAGLVIALGIAALLALFVAVQQIQAAGEPVAVVNVTALNLRAGPGLSYRVLDVLVADEEVSLLGRSSDGFWVEVNQTVGTGGWMYSPYLDTNASIASLPVTVAAGGPLTPAQPPAVVPSNNGNFPLFTAITNDVAVVTLQQYPANADVVVKLGRVGQIATFVVAQGRTDANGMTQLTFDMPSRWADGSQLVETQLILSAGTVDGNFNINSTIDYTRF